MQLVLVHDGREQEVDLTVEGLDACVGDLVASVDGEAPGAGVAIGGRWFPPEQGLDEIGLHEGAVVTVTRSDRTPPAVAPAGPVLVVVGGPASGPTHALDGEVLIGRDFRCDVRVCDPSISAQHARLRPAGGGEWELTDLGSHNGTWVGDQPVHGRVRVHDGALLRLGATHVRILRGLPEDRPMAVDPLFRAAGGMIPFNRPPRPALPAEPAAMTAPEAPAETRGGRAFSVIAFLAPIAIGGVIVYITGRWYYALFMLLSPVMLLANWLSARRQAKREDRTTKREFAEGMTRLTGELETAKAAELDRREQLLPDPSEVVRRAGLPSTSLWQRRPHHSDFMLLRAGIADLRWEPEVTTKAQQDLHTDVEEILEAHRTLHRAPAEIDLSSDGVVGVVGDRAAALALARSLVCQAAVHHGPADMGLVVLAAAGQVRDWDWVKWLPHSRDASGGARALSGDAETSAGLLTALLAAGADQDDRGSTFGGAKVGADATAGPLRLVVIDDLSLLEGRRAPGRLLLQGRAGPVAGIVLAPTADQLPAITTTVVDLRSDLGDAELHRPQEGTSVEGLVACGVEERTARAVARTLARYEDPELELAGAGLPGLVRLLPLLGLDDDADHASQVATAWQAALPEPRPRTPVGLGEDGIVSLDLVSDGPHALIGGTTGSGKSELLRSLIAGLAAGSDPDHLVFVLVDYKGGSAFDECARLPHTVGMVTDLDEHLGERALVSLEAELSHRERVLRAAEAQDLPAYLAAGAPSGPLPRLVVVIDEFATLATELPDFLGALVGVAQRGRSLGVHLVLATQRPSGAVNANIKANTNLRIALRVQSDADSTDIIDRRDAARLSRSQPGRAYVRLGAGDVVLLQSALSTARLSSTGEVAGVRLQPYGFGPRPAARPEGGEVDEEAPTDLERLADAIRRAFQHGGFATPRRPWLPMLAETVELTTILDAAGTDDAPVPIALADEPSEQAQVPVGWDPREGHMALFGMVGSGTTSALVTVASALAERFSPDDCHLHALDFGARHLEVLRQLPHVGAVVGATDGEGRHRLIRHLRAELDRRRLLTPDELEAEPWLVTLVDGIGALLAELEQIENLESGDAFKRVFADGPGARILLVVGGDRPGALPMRLGGMVGRRYLFKLSDPNEFSSIGVRANKVPGFVPGRALSADGGTVVQFGLASEELLAGLAARWPAPQRPPLQIEGLPAEVAFAELATTAALDDGVTRMAIGIADADLGPAVLEVFPSDHLTIAGPPRSGKSSTLALIAAQVRRADPDAIVVGIASERSPLRAGEGVLDAAGDASFLSDLLRTVPDDERRWWVLIDDAAFVEDHQGVFARLVRCARPGVHVVVAGRGDDLRSSYGHWTRQVRQSRSGVLLQPELSGDGDLLSVKLPKRLPVPLVPGRGFLVANGDLHLVQIAHPPVAQEH